MAGTSRILDLEEKLLELGLDEKNFISIWCAELLWYTQDRKTKRLSMQKAVFILIDETTPFNEQLKEEILNNALKFIALVYLSENFQLFCKIDIIRSYLILPLIHHWFWLYIIGAGLSDNKSLCKLANNKFVK